MDPWNGSGTTTAAASLFGHRSLGFDLNPAMAVAAKARLLPTVELPSIRPLLTDIKQKAFDHGWPCNKEDPLLTWFAPEAAIRIRSIDRAIHSLLVSRYSTVATVDEVSKLSGMAAFFYVALFRTVRVLLKRFTRSNPTWLVRPARPQGRVRPTRSDLAALFTRQVLEMSGSVEHEPSDWDFGRGHCSISVASSESLPVADRSVDFVLSSPPYCTRIDYGVATLPELAVLGLGLASQFIELRKKLIGTPTIQDAVPRADKNWGQTCSAFLRQLRKHPSKAARSYYYKTFAQYFSGISRSLSELSRCMKTGANCVIVVQDSYFKNLRVDLASIFTEMSEGFGFAPLRRTDFQNLRTFANINSRSRSYRNETSATESILVFLKD